MFIMFGDLFLVLGRTLHTFKMTTQNLKCMTTQHLILILTSDLCLVVNSVGLGYMKYHQNHSQVEMDIIFCVVH